MMHFPLFHFFPYFQNISESGKIFHTFGKVFNFSKKFPLHPPKLLKTFFGLSLRFGNPSIFAISPYFCNFPLFSQKTLHFLPIYENLLLSLCCKIPPLI